MKMCRKVVISEVSGLSVTFWVIFAKNHCFYVFPNTFCTFHRIPRENLTPRKHEKPVVNQWCLEKVLNLVIFVKKSKNGIFVKTYED